MPGKQKPWIFSSWLTAPLWLYEKPSLPSWLLQWFSGRPKPTLQVTHCNCSLLFTAYKKGTRDRGCELTQLPWRHERLSHQFLAWGMKFFIFPEGWDWELRPAALLLWRALIIPWTKPNHGGESSVDLWDVWGCAVFPLRKRQRSSDRWKSCQRKWILGHKCLVHLKTFWELHEFTFFFRWKLNEEIREAKSTHILYANRSRDTCVQKEPEFPVFFFSLSDCHLNASTKSKTDVFCRCPCCRWWLFGHKPT